MTMRPNADAVDFTAALRQIINDTISQLPRAREVIVVPNSWDGSEGTVRVRDATTLTESDLDPDASDPLFHDPLPVSGGHIGDQGAPIGFERGIAFPVEGGGWRVMLDHGPDDSPNALPGEVYRHLRDFDKHIVSLCFVKVQKDATRIGHKNKIVALAQNVELGAEDIARDGYRIVTDSFMQDFGDRIVQAVQDAFNSLCQRLQSGQGVPPPQVQKQKAKGSNTSFST